MVIRLLGFRNGGIRFGREHGLAPTFFVVFRAPGFNRSLLFGRRTVGCGASAPDSAFGAGRRECSWVLLGAHVAHASKKTQLRGSPADFKFGGESSDQGKREDPHGRFRERT